MRILITGGAGFVGRHTAHHLSSHGHKVTATYYRNEPRLNNTDIYQVDITNRERVKTVIRRTKPEVIIHAAAMADADKCEQHPKKAKEVNVGGTKVIVQNAEEVDASLVLISSSFVFDGKKSIYTEDTPHNPINVYGRTKAAAERTVEAANILSTIVRIDQPYGWSTDWQTDSMVEWVLNQLDSQTGTIEVFSNWSNNPIHNKDVAEFIRSLLEGKHRGTYNVVGPEFINRYNWARRIAAVFGYDINRIQPSISDHEAHPARRPNAALSTIKTVSTLDCSPVGIYDGLYWMLNGNNVLFNQS